MNTKHIRSFGINELMLICFEFTILLKLELGDVRDAALLGISHEQTFSFS